MSFKIRASKNGVFEKLVKFLEYNDLPSLTLELGVVGPVEGAFQ